MDIPVVNMILRSGWVAKAILLLLGCFSVVAWAVVFQRFSFLGRNARAMLQFRNKLLKVSTVADLQNLDPTLKKSLIGTMAKTGADEYRRILDDAQSHDGILDWSFFLESQFAMANERLGAEQVVCSTKLTSGLVILAICSNTAPFLGLLGTCWGIMDAFFDIGTQGSASLPVVAPGIAEALIATIIGLAVAIPASLFYNYFVHRVEKLEDEIEELKTLVIGRIKREILNLLYGTKPGTKAH